MKTLLTQLLSNKLSLYAVNSKKGLKGLSNKEKAEYAEFLYNCFYWLSSNFHNLFSNNKLNLSQHQAYCVINNLFGRATYRALQLNVPDVKMCKRKINFDLNSLNDIEPYSEKEELETIIKAFQSLLECLAYDRNYSEREITYPIRLGVIKLLRQAVNFETKAKKFTDLPLTLSLPVFSEFESTAVNSSDKSSTPFASVYPSELKTVTGRNAFGG